MSRAACVLTVLLALAGPWGAGARRASAQVNDNVLWGGVPNQYGLNGLWWGGYNAFSPPNERPGAFAGWWDFYIPPAEPAWNGPYYSTPHWEPYVPRPIGWNGLEYGVAN